jgi:hypothetical protein
MRAASFENDRGLSASSLGTPRHLKSLDANSYAAFFGVCSLVELVRRSDFRFRNASSRALSFEKAEVVSSLPLSCFLSFEMSFFNAAYSGSFAREKSP